MNVRANPSTSAAVVGQLADDVRVMMVEGSDIEGCAVESVNDNGTMLQTLLPG